MKLGSQIRGIIWDWNGTLLNDTRLAVDAMNRLLHKRSLPFLSPGEYKKVFTFPVRDYYQLIGFDFDKEPFEIPALEFIDHYNQMVWDCSLHEHAKEVLSYFRNCGISQHILSAMKQEMLDQCLKYYQIVQYFEMVSGLDDHFANSKLDAGRAMIRKLNLKSKELLLIGDTIHDFEVASELGCICILISNGHQTYERLKSTGAMVLEDLTQLMN